LKRYVRDKIPILDIEEHNIDAPLIASLE